MNASHPEHPWIYQKSFQITRTNHSKKILKNWEEHVLSFSKLLSLLKIKTNTSYKQTNKNLQIHDEILAFMCYCCGFRLMYGLKGSFEAKLQERPFSVRKGKQKMWKDWKPALCFWTWAKYRLLARMACDRPWSSLNFMFSYSGMLMLIMLGRKRWSY